MRDSVPRGKLISEMDANDRPREKALSQGFDRLTDAELLAIIFATGTREKSVLELRRYTARLRLSHVKAGVYGS